MVLFSCGSNRLLLFRLKFVRVCNRIDCNSPESIVSHFLLHSNFPGKRGFQCMRISVVVPVYNEEETVAQVLESLSQVPLDLEVVVVDDASTDRTWEILQELRNKEPFNTYRYVRHERNQGKGVGLRTGFGLVSGDMVTIQDADMEYDPQDLPALVAKWEEGTAQGLTKVAVYGYRDLSAQKFTTRWGNRFLTTMTNILFGSRIHDMETCYKLIPGVVAR